MHGIDLFDSVASVVVTALVNGLWQGVLLLGLAWLLLRIVEVGRPLNATTRYAVWAVMLTAMVCLPVGAGMMATTQSDVSLLKPASNETVVLLPETEGAPVLAFEDAFLEEPSHPSPAKSGQLLQGGGFGGPEQQDVQFVVRPMVAEEADASLTASVVLVDDVASSAPVLRPSAWRLTIPRSIAPWMPFLLGVWLLVVLVLLARVAYGCVYVRRLKRHSTPLSPVYQRRLDAWRRVYGLRRSVHIGGVESLTTPVAVGLWRPMILTPVVLLDHLTEEEFDQVVLHELAHVQRRDDWTNLFQKLVQAILFFHPAVHWIGRQMEQEREMACDDWVVSLTRRPKAYASCLTRLVELNVRSRVALVAPGMAVRKEHVFERVRRLLDHGQLVTARLSRAGFLTVVLALVAAVLLMARIAPFFAPPEPEAMGRGESEPLVEPGVAVLVEPRPGVRAEPGAVSVDIEPLIVSVAQTVPEPAGLTIDIAPMGVLSSAVITVPDTILTFRQIRLSRLHNTAGIHPARQTLEVTRPSLRSAGERHQDLSLTSWIRVLKASAHIASGGDRARFLIEAVPRMPDNEQVYAAYLETAGTIGSSGDRQRALSVLLDHHRLGEASMLLFLESVQRVPSGGDRARLLIEIAPVLPYDDAVHKTYLEVAESLSSSGDYQRVLSALMKAQR